MPKSLSNTLSWIDWIWFVKKYQKMVDSQIYMLIYKSMAIFRGKIIVIGIGTLFSKHGSLLYKESLQNLMPLSSHQVDKVP